MNGSDMMKRPTVQPQCMILLHSRRCGISTNVHCLCTYEYKQVGSWSPIMTQLTQLLNCDHANPFGSFKHLHVMRIPSQHSIDTGERVTGGHGIQQWSARK